MALGRVRGGLRQATDGPVARALARYTRVGLDTICFIYHLSRHPRYLPLTAELFTLVEAGRIAAVTSSLALVEILTRPKELGHQAAADSYKVALATFPNLELRRSDVAITTASGRSQSPLPARNA